MGTKGTTRREFLENTAAVALAAPLLPQSRPGSSRPPKTIVAYVGCYSSPREGRGEGIYVFEVNPSTGGFSQREVFPDKTNPSWLALNPAGTHLYAANEMGGSAGAVSAFSIERNTGKLTLLNRAGSEGGGPTHISVHPAGKHVLVANYGSGTVTVLPIRPGGELAPASDVKAGKGAVGPGRASSAPRGSFAISGHERAHAHMVEADRTGRFVIAADLGLDQLFVWKFDIDKGALTPNDPPSVQLPPGDGPRHFAFHPNGSWLYSLQEEGSTIVAFDFDNQTGRFASKQTVSTLPKGFTGTNFTSEIRVSPDGKFVYAANRLHDSIAVFAIGTQGTLTPAGEEWTRGDYPRSITIDPTGRFLYSCNEKGDAITIFRVDRDTGRLTFTGDYVPVGAPACIVFWGVPA